MNFRPLLSLLGMLFVFLLMVLVVLKIWMPDFIDNDSFVKVALTFGAVGAASVVIVFLSGGSRKGGEEKGEAEKE